MNNFTLNTLIHSRCDVKKEFTFSGLSNKFTSRILGFSIYVSNTTDMLDGKLCYKENIFNTSTIPPGGYAECDTHGQYVFYYNERLKGIAYPDDYSTYAYNDICEFVVRGKNFHFML